MFCKDCIEINKLEYKAPESNRSGGKVVKVTTVPGSVEWKDRIRFQMSENNETNLQQAVWGLSTPLAGQDPSRRTLELTVESADLMRFLEQLDAKNVDCAVKHSTEWFKKSLEPEAIKNMYVKLIKDPTKEGQKPTVRVKVKCGDYPTNIFIVQSTEDGSLEYTKGTHEDLTRNVKCLAMVESAGLWFMSRQFGMALTATDILVWPNRRTTGIEAFTMNNVTPKKSVAPPEEMVVDI